MVPVHPGPPRIRPLDLTDGLERNPEKTRNSPESLHAFLESRGLKMPGWTTILENVNLVSHATRELIFDKQIEYVLKENLDDFKELTLDSTAVKANSSWPTDGKILTGILERIHSDI